MAIQSTSRLKLMQDKWFKKAEVKRAASFEALIPFEHDRIDFLPELLPFNQHPLWQSQCVELKNKVLSYGWMMYNLRTIYIETKIVSPFCQQIINRQIDIVKDYSFQSLLAQTLIDEAYHVLISIEGYESVLAHRGLPILDLPEFDFHLQIKRSLAKATTLRQKELITLAVVVASEILISGYLSNISNSDIVQPLFRYITYVHWKDELAHGGVFREIVDKLFNDLKKEEQQFLLHIIEQANQWFTDPELEVWRCILEHCQIQHVDEILDCRFIATNTSSHQLAFRKINQLISSLEKKIVGEKWNEYTDLKIESC